MSSLIFVTCNKNKFEKAKEKLAPLGIQISQKELPIIEPQEENIINVAEFKAEQAYGLVKCPVVVADSGWSIPALKGFPGPFMHYLSDWFTAEDFLALMDNKKDKTIFLQNVVAYKDDKTLKTFEATRKGRFLTEVRGEGIPIDRIITFREDGKTVSECQRLGISSFDENNFVNVWTLFGEWYSPTS